MKYNMLLPWQIPPRGRVVLIEYDKYRRPFTVVVQEDKSEPRLTDYDFDWCGDYGLYYNCSGSGGHKHTLYKCSEPSPRILVWVSDRNILEPPGNLDDLADYGYQLIADPLPLGEATTNPFDVAIEGEIVWCKICKTHVPCEYEHNLCRHLFWDDYWSGIGSDEGFIEDQKDPIISFVKMIRDLPDKGCDVIGLIVEAMERNDCNMIDGWLGSHCLFDSLGIEGKGETLESGFGWLCTLGGDGTEEANALVASWIRGMAK